MAENKMVSVLVPVYNEEKYIGQCLNSLLGQSYKNTEIIVLFDTATSDASAQILEKFGKKIKVVRHRHISISRSLNLGVKSAKGGIILYAEGDCIYLPDCVERAAGEFSDPKVGGVAVLQEFFDNNSLLGRVQNEFQQLRNLWFLQGRLPLTWCYFYRKDLIGRLGGFNESLKQGGEDRELPMRIIKAGYRIALPAGVLRRHAVSGTLNSMGKIAKSSFRAAYMHAIQHYSAQPLAAKFLFFFSLLASGAIALAAPRFAFLPLAVMLLAYLAVLLGLLPWAKRLSLSALLVVPFLVVWRAFFYCLGMLYGLAKQGFVDVSSELREM